MSKKMIQEIMEYVEADLGMSELLNSLPLIAIDNLLNHLRDSGNSKLLVFEVANDEYGKPCMIRAVLDSEYPNYTFSF